MEDVVNYCRLCLKKRGIKHELFDPKSGAESHGNVILNLMGVALTALERWPSAACTACVKNLNSLLDFKNTIVTTQFTLEAMLGSAHRQPKVEMKEDCDAPAVLSVPPEVHFVTVPMAEVKETPVTTPCPEKKVKVAVKRKKVTSKAPPSAKRTKTEKKPIVKRKRKKWPEKQLLVIDAEFQKRNLLTCPDCPKDPELTWDTFQGFREHMRGVHKRSPYIMCCETKFVDSKALEHMQYHMNETIFRCLKCNINFFSRSQLKVHNEYRHVDFKTALFKCKTCKRGFNYEPQYRAHMVKHATTNDFICEVCGKGFKSDNLREQHHTRIHEERQTVACPVCGLQVLNLKRHTDYKHKEAEKIECEHCHRMIRKKYVATHFREQHAEPTLECNVCSKMFRTRDKLKQHVNQHLGIRIPCLFCEHSATNKGNLATHYKKNHAEDYEAYLLLRKTTPRVKNAQ